jgi:gliding motility-associated-like protein
MKIKLILSLGFVLCIRFLVAQTEPGSMAEGGSAILSFQNGFIENKGQLIDQLEMPVPSVKYLTNFSGLNIQLRQTGFSYDSYTDELKTDEKGKINPVRIKQAPADHLIRHYHRVDVELLHCNPNAELIATGASETYFNYFTTGTSDGGISYIHSYKEVVYKDIYPHTDLKFLRSSLTGKVAYEFILHPGALVNDIQMGYNGANKVTLDNGEIKINVSGGMFSERIPESYWKKNRIRVAVNYVSIGKNIFSFSLPDHTSLEDDLIIDPEPCLSWGTYYDSWVFAATVLALDKTGCTYIAESTPNTSNIATTGAYQSTNGGGAHDAFVAKFNPGGTALVWGTYYGGSGDDDAEAIAIDASNNVYITGSTLSSANIATPGAFQTTWNGPGSNAFVAKFNPSGSALLWGTYFGLSSGNASTNAYSITTDTHSNVYITGVTNAPGMATTGAYQTAIASASITTSVGFVTRFNAAGTTKVCCTYYGDATTEGVIPAVIRLDKIGNICIAGETIFSHTNLASPGTFQTTDLEPTANGSGFVAKFDSTCSSRLWGTYFGGPGGTGIGDIMLDKVGNITFTGNTASTTDIATPGAYQFSYGGGGEDAFVAKLNAGGSSLLWGTYYGGNDTDVGYALTQDVDKNIYVTGIARSTAGIATAGVYQPVFAGATDVFIAKFDTTARSLLWGTYYGGALADYVYGIAVDSIGDIYVSGSTESTSGIATPGAYQTNYTGTSNGCSFVAKLTCNPISPRPPLADQVSSVGPLPNIFTPNGDNLNDTFRIPSKHLKSLHCFIYNRWGNQVGEINTPEGSWTGNTSGNKFCSDGVYYYSFTAQGEDNVNYSNKGFLQLER